MSGFDPKEYERTGGNYEIEPTQAGLMLFGEEIDPDSRFAQDFSAFTRLNTELYKQAVGGLDTEVPDEYTLRAFTAMDTNWTNTSVTELLMPNALFSAYVSYKVMQRLGYRVALVPRDSGEADLYPGADRAIAVYQHKDEVAVTTNAMDVTAGRFLIARATTGSAVHRGLLDRMRPNSWYTQEDLKSIQGTGLVERAFMTGVLLKVRSNLLEPTDIPFIQEDLKGCMELYEDLASVGFTALGPEEIFGVVEKDIREWLKEHPEHAPLESKGN